MARKKNRFQQELKRIIEYMISGGAQFWSGYAAFAILDLIFKVPFWPSRVVSYGIGVVVNFYLQRFWVFRKKGLSKKQIHQSAEKYYGLMFTNFLLDLAIVGGLYELAGVSPYIGQFVSAGFFTVYNYLLFKFWVFRGRQSKPSQRKRRVAPATRVSARKKQLAKPVAKRRRSRS